MVWDDSGVRWFGVSWPGTEVSTFHVKVWFDMFCCTYNAYKYCTVFFTVSQQSFQNIQRTVCLIYNGFVIKKTSCGDFWWLIVLTFLSPWQNTVCSHFSYFKWSINLNLSLTHISKYEFFCPNIRVKYLFTSDVNCIVKYMVISYMLKNFFFMMILVTL